MNERANEVTCSSIKIVGLRGVAQWRTGLFQNDRVFTSRRAEEEFDQIIKLLLLLFEDASLETQQSKRVVVWIDFQSNATQAGIDLVTRDVIADGHFFGRDNGTGALNQLKSNDDNRLINLLTEKLA